MEMKFYRCKHCGQIIAVVKATGAKAKVAGTVNLAGQQVGADYKGVVIKDGKKVMQ